MSLPRLADIRLALLRRVTWITRSERLFILLVPVVGVGTGLISVGISKLMSWTQARFWGSDLDILAAAKAASPLRLVLAPTLGGVAIAAIILFAKRPLRGGGVGGLIEAVALRGGYLETYKTILIQLIAVFTVGAGGSAGREGPLTVSGATLGSKLGRLAGLSGNNLKILVGCGTAAGMAAAYNAPVGGALFAMEVVLGNFALETFGPIVIAAVIATEISRRFLFAPPHQSVYDIPTYVLEQTWVELLLFVILGVLAGGLAVVFIESMERGDKLFEKLRTPEWSKPIIGFACIGLIGLFCPYIFGNGFETVDLQFHQRLVDDLELTYLGSQLTPIAGVLFLLLPLVKLLATSITIGSGGAGGLFTPSLFVGSLVGSAFGLAVGEYGVGLVTHSTVPYSLVGMGAIAAATTKAPISAILIIYEITRSYDIILPLMVACIASNLVAGRFKHHSLFTARMARRGIEVPHRLEELVMETMTARDLVREDRLILRPKDAVPEIFARFLDTRRNHLYVVGAKHSFLGAVSMHDLKRVLLQSREMTFILAHDVLYSDYPYVIADDRLTRVLAEFAQHDHERLPVLEDHESRRFLGFIAKRDLMSVYNQEVLNHPTLLAKFTTDRAEGQHPTYVELPPRYRIDQVTVGRVPAGRTLAELDLPRQYGAHVLEVKRLNDRGLESRLIPDGTTVLQHRDRLIVLGPLDQVARLKAAIDEPKPTKPADS